MQQAKAIRLVMISFIIASISLISWHWLVSINIFAQSNNIDNKRFASEELDGSPYGLIIIFIDDTTFVEANELRIEYGLKLHIYRDDTGWSYYTPDKDTYTPNKALYDPVNEITEALLLADSRVAKLDNRNDVVLYIFKMAVETIRVIPYIWYRLTAPFIGGTVS